MIVIPDERRVESPYIEWVAHGYTAADGFEMRPAGYHWHLIFTRDRGVVRSLVVGTLEEARPLAYTAGAESLWIRFKVGTFMPFLPAPALLNREITLPESGRTHFWLQDKVWEIPNYENVEIFVAQLARAGAVTHDPLIEAGLRDELVDTSERTVRYRFQHSTGLRQNSIRQMKRAERARELLYEGNSIIHTAQELGYADQPHLTRSLKRLLGYTPRELLRKSQTE
ncbi:MAG: helix-turn-helix domain-containing protein [Chloroflexi bacterium]|nr:helix-turn-helix domain-containing protein [Chloroflexota bacterium]